MKKELTAADLALYIGCEVVVSGETETVMKLYGVSDNVHGRFVRVCRIDDEYISWPIEVFRVKPILRPLLDMTEAEENSQIWDTIPEYTDFQGLVKHISPVFLWLIHQHFDLFGWIEAGLAIDKTKLK